MSNDLTEKTSAMTDPHAMLEVFRSSGFTDTLFSRWRGRAQKELAQEGAAYVAAMTAAHKSFVEYTRSVVELEGVQKELAAAQHDRQYTVEALNEIRKEDRDEVVGQYKENLKKMIKMGGLTDVEASATALERQRVEKSEASARLREWEQVAKPRKEVKEEKAPSLEVSQTIKEAIAADLDKRFRPILEQFHKDDPAAVDKEMADIIQQHLDAIDDTIASNF